VEEFSVYISTKTIVNAECDKLEYIFEDIPFDASPISNLGWIVGHVLDA